MSSRLNDSKKNPATAILFPFRQIFFNGQEAGQLLELRWRFQIANQLDDSLTPQRVFISLGNLQSRLAEMYETCSIHFCGGGLACVPIWPFLTLSSRVFIIIIGELPARSRRDAKVKSSFHLQSHPFLFGFMAPPRSGRLTGSSPIGQLLHYDATPI